MSERKDNSMRREAILVGLCVASLEMMCSGYVQGEESSQKDYESALPFLRYNLYKYPVVLPEDLGEFIKQKKWKELIIQKIKELGLLKEFIFGLHLYTAYARVMRGEKDIRYYKDLIESGLELGIPQGNLLMLVNQFKTATAANIGQIIESFIKEQFPDSKNEDKVWKVLFCAADPTDESRLRLPLEFREINEQLILAKQRENFRLVLPQLAVRAKDISRALLDEQPHIIHFSGHGTPDGELCFENESGKTQRVRPEVLSTLFELFADKVVCVILNACYAETQAKAIAKHIDYVIGMKKEIDDRAAIAFSVGFYQALGAGRTIEEAFKLGCAQAGFEESSARLIPVLIKKKRTK